MHDRRFEEKKENVSARIIAFLQRYRAVFLILAAAGVLFPIVYYIIEANNQKITLEGAKMMYDIDRKINEYRGAAEKEKKAAVEKELFSIIDESAARFRGRYAAAYGLLQRVDVNFKKLADGDAADKKETVLLILRDLSRIIDDSGDSILVPVALRHLGTCLRNIETLAPAETGSGAAVRLDDILNIVPAKIRGEGTPASVDDLAFSVYRYLSEQFPKSLYAQESLVSMGFLSEAKGDDRLAYELYGKLESGFTPSLWTKIAVNRRIALETSGRIPK